MNTLDTFFKAVRNNDLIAVAKLLTENPALANTRMPGDSSILNYQVWLDRKMVPVSGNEKRSGTALHFAAIWGKTELAKLLLEHGAEVDAMAYENNHEQTPAIVLAAWEGGTDVLRLLLKAGADPNLQSSNGVTALSTAKRHNKKDRVKLLLKFGAEG
ncbi:MAG: ankyrin repeat domain-containing protein [bacterium]|nr:ankyrin repeat domain-containing protein [bacterium]